MTRSTERIENAAVIGIKDSENRFPGSNCLAPAKQSIIIKKHTGALLDLKNKCPNKQKKLVVREKSP